MSDERDIRIDQVRELLREKGEDVWPGGRDNTANVVREKRRLSEPLPDDEASRRMFIKTLIGSVVGGVAAAAGILAWWEAGAETKSALFDRAFAFNERVGSFFFRPQRLAPEFPLDRVTEARVNGMEGLDSEVDLSAWRLSVAGLPGQNATELTLDEIKQFPRTEMVTELKCIEGWSIIVHWAGVRVSDFVTACAPNVSPDQLPRYVSMLTPDEGYFVGWDTPSIMHPQTLLAYEMNGEPLTNEHGAPLRLASPTKYGIKQIKRIGRIEFTNERPRDYWAEEGYDWYSGH